MTEPEVEAVFKAKPNYSGNAEAGSCKIYGSDERFHITANHSVQVMVVFTDGKASVIYSTAIDEDWLPRLRQKFPDLSAQREGVNEKNAGEHK